MSAEGGLLIKLGMEAGDFSRKIQDSRKQLQAFERGMKKTFGPELLRLSANVTKAMAGITIAMGALGAKAIWMAGEIEQQKVAFETLLGSGRAAEKMLKELRDFAATTPFKFDELVGASKKMLAFGFEADKVTETLRKVGDAAAGLSLGGDGVERIIMALGKMQAKGKVSAQEITRLTEMGVAAWDYLAQAAGKSIAETQEMVTKGTYDAGAGIKAILAGMDRQFSGLMAKQSQTIHGLTSTLGDNLTDLMRTVGDKLTAALPIKEALQGSIDAFASINRTLQEEGLLSALDEMTGKSVALQAALVGVAAAMTAITAPTIALGLATLRKQLILLQLSVPLLAGIAAAAAAIYGLVRAGYFLANNWEYLSALMTKVGAQLYNLFSYAYTGAVYYLNMASVWVAQKFRDMIAGMLSAFHEFGGNLQRSGTAAGKMVGDAFVAMGAAAHGALRTADEMLTKSRQAAGQAREAFDKASNSVAGTWREITRLKEGYDMLRGYIDSVSKALAGQLPWWDSAMDKMTEYGNRAASVAAQLSGLNAIMSLFGGGGAESEPAPTPKPSGGGGGGKKSKTVENLADIRREVRDMFAEFQRLAGAKTGSAAFFAGLKIGMADTMRKWDDAITGLQAKWAEASQAAKASIVEAMNEAGIQYRITEQGKLDTTRARIALEEMLEKEKQRKIQQYIITGQALEDDLRAAQNERDFAAYVALLDRKNAAFLSHLQAEKQAMDQYRRFREEANRSELSYMTEAYGTLYDGLSSTLTDVIMGTKKAGDAFKELGKQMIAMVVRWMVQRKLAATFAKGLEKAALASSTVSATALAAAWAKPAALAAMATMGAAGPIGMAAVSATLAGTKALAAIPLAKGGIVSAPTLAMVGEGRHKEAVIPLSDSVLSKLGGGKGDVTVHVHNNTGTPANVRQERTFDGQETIVNVWLDAYQRNVGGLRDAVGSQRR
jgi:tape measure domain-containing protein